MFKIPYWILALISLYFGFAYSSGYSLLSRYLKRPLYKDNNTVNYTILVYLFVIIFIKLSYLAAYLVSIESDMFNNIEIRNQLFPYITHGDISNNIDSSSNSNTNANDIDNLDAYDPINNNSIEMNYSLLFWELILEILLGLYLIYAIKFNNSNNTTNTNNPNTNTANTNTNNTNTDILAQIETNNNSPQKNKALVYSDYYNYNNEKLLTYIIFFVGLISTIILNVSLVNCVNLLLLSAFMVFLILYPLDYYRIDIINKYFTLVSFCLLIVHYSKNVSVFKNSKVDKINGFADFDDSLLTTFFISYLITFCISCILQDYSYIGTEVEEYIGTSGNAGGGTTGGISSNVGISVNVGNTNNTNTNNTEFFMNEAKIETENYNLTVIKTFCYKYILFVSSFCYKMLLFFWILFHVCLVMFVNFIFLFFGVYKIKIKYKNNFLIPSFLTSLFFTILQYIYNINGIFIFQDIKMYKWLEIVGIYKYYKPLVLADFSNMFKLDIENSEKTLGMLIDSVIITFLFIFAYVIVYDYAIKEKNQLLVNNKPIKSRLTSEDLKKFENDEIKEKNEPKLPKNTSKFFNLIEKSYIFSLVLLFLVSTVKQDLIHAIYFIFFIILVFSADSNFKKYWDMIIHINTFIIIIILYFWNIMALNFLNLEEEMNLDNSVFNYLGLKVDRNSIFFIAYWEYIVIYLIGFLQNFLYVTNYHIYNTPVDLDEMFKKEEDMKIENLYSVPAYLYGLFSIVIFLNMLVLSTIKPLSFQGMVYLICTILFIIVLLFCPSKYKLKVSSFSSNLVIVISIVLASMKYLANVKCINTFLKNFFNLEDSNSLNFSGGGSGSGNGKSNDIMENSVFGSTSSSVGKSNLNLNTNANDLFDNDITSSTSSNIKNFSMEDFGFDSENFMYKMLLVCCLIILLNVIKIFYYTKKQDNKDDKKDSNKNEANNNSSLQNFYIGSLLNRSSDEPSYRFACFLTNSKIFVYQLIYLHASKIMLLVSVFVCVCLESMVGVILFGVILISLFMERDTYWKYSFFPLIFISMFIMCFVYLCNLGAIKKWMTKDYEWFGVYNTRGYSMLFDLFPYVCIIFFSFLSRISNSFKGYYKDSEDLSIKKKKGNNTNTNNTNTDKDKDKTKGNNNNNNSSPIKNKDDISTISSNNSNNNSEHFNMHFSEELIKLQYEKYEEEIIYKLSLFWHSLDYIWFLFGFYIVLVITMLIAFNKINLLSLIFMGFVGFQSFSSYKRNEYKTSNESSQSELIRIRNTWINFGIFLSIASFLQYLNYMWFPPSWKIVKPWENISFNCSKDGRSIYSTNSRFKAFSDYEYCVDDWKAWLNIDNYSTKDIFMNFICLFLIVITQKYFVISNESIDVEKEKDKDKNKETNKNLNKETNKEPIKITNKEPIKEANKESYYNPAPISTEPNQDNPENQNNNQKDDSDKQNLKHNILISTTTPKELSYTDKLNQHRPLFNKNKLNYDFTIPENRKTFIDTLKYFLFIYFKSIILFFIILISIIYSYKSTNIIYGGFLFISFYLLFKNSSLTKHKNTLWIIVQYYNFIVLIGFMLFQTPFLPCPVNRDERAYLGLEECLLEENRIYTLYGYNNESIYPKDKMDALYIVMVQTIGVQKLEFNLLILGNFSFFLIYITSIIQQIIFDHPYQAYVKDYLEREKEINNKSRAFKIVQDSHLERHWEYRKVFTLVEMLNYKLKRLDKKITEYSNLWKQTNSISSYNNNVNSNHNPNNVNNNGNKNLDVEDLEHNTNTNNPNNPNTNNNNLNNNPNNPNQNNTRTTEEERKKEEHFKEEIEKMLEDLISDEEQDIAGLIDFKEIKEKLDKIRKEVRTKQKIQNAIEKEKGQLEDNHNKQKLENNNSNSAEEEAKLIPVDDDYLENKKILEEKTLKMKQNLFKELKEEIVKIQALQVIKDRTKLYEGNYHGLNIASTEYKEIVKDHGELHPKAVAFCDISLLKKIFVNNEKINLQENQYSNKLEIKMSSQQQEQLQLDNKENKEENISLIESFRKFLLEMRDPLLLIDLVKKNNANNTNTNTNANTNTNTNKDISKANENNFCELILFTLYSNVEFILVLAFIINACIDASIMSIIYPLIYFGYGLIEYPFPGKFFWKVLIVYSLITITVKLAYQFPFFCGYPFYSLFNIFNDSYCESYSLTNLEIMEGFDYMFGLRKYTGEYSYPKNTGLLSGILWDIIILSLLLIQRSYLKSKGIWNFININKEFNHSPIFENKNTDYKNKYASSYNNINNTNNSMNVSGNNLSNIENNTEYNNNSQNRELDTETSKSDSSLEVGNNNENNNNTNMGNDNNDENIELLGNDNTPENNTNTNNTNTPQYNNTNTNTNTNEIKEESKENNNNIENTNNNNNPNTNEVYENTNNPNTQNTPNTRSPTKQHTTKTIKNFEEIKNLPIPTQQTQSHQPQSQPTKYIKENTTFSNTISNFFKRLVPELFFSPGKSITYKPGRDYYPKSFVVLLTILIYTTVCFSSMNW